MNKIAVVICIIGFWLLSSCAYVTRTYDLKVVYTQTLPLDGQTQYMQQKIRSMMTLSGQGRNRHLNDFVLNGRLFTVKMRRNNIGQIDRLIQYTLYRPGDSLTIVSTISR